MTEVVISSTSSAQTPMEVRQGCLPALWGGLWGGEVRLAALASASRHPMLTEKGEAMHVIALDHWPKDVEVGELIVTVVVRAANVVSDIRENIRNLVGGRMRHYEAMIQRAVEEAIEETQRKAKEAGYDGVIGLKIANPSVVDGGVEVIVYANGFRFLPAP
ncbi:YbjQ family protein [Myxococcota bacterium]|nr:YbjQ family protein [Myxococcota bacterium]